MNTPRPGTRAWLTTVNIKPHGHSPLTIRVQLGADLRGLLLAHGADALVAVPHAPEAEGGALAEGDDVLLAHEGGHDRAWLG